MSITVVQNNSTTFNISSYLTDRGWSITSPTVLKHVSPNEGFFEYFGINILNNVTYEYSFNVQNMNDGEVYITIGGAQTEVVDTDGYYEGQLEAVSTEGIRVWGSGDFEIRDINIKAYTQDREEIDGKEDTITWSEQRKNWITFKDIVPESGFSMFTSMFTLKNGELWKHVVDGTIPNNFYGVQYSSKVQFPVSSVGVKTYHTIAIHANKVLGTTEDGITTQLGNVTDLITYDFDTVEGIHYANKLRDAILDEKLKGRYLIVELTDEETNTEHLQLFKVVVKGEISSPNE